MYVYMYVCMYLNASLIRTTAFRHRSQEKNLANVDRYIFRQLNIQMDRYMSVCVCVYVFMSMKKCRLARFPRLIDEIHISPSKAWKKRKILRISKSVFLTLRFQVCIIKYRVCRIVWIIKKEKKKKVQHDLSTYS